MGWFMDLFKGVSDKPASAKQAEVLNGYAPIFSQFGQNVYASDVVQQAIGCIVQEIKKLRPQHILGVGNDIVPVNSDIQKVLDNPNPLMTTSEFLEKVTWLLYLNYNVFIIPTYYEWADKKTGTVKRKYDGLYPIQPSQVDFIEDASGKLFVKFRFNNGQEFTVNYADVIHIKKNYSVNQYMGGNEAGQPDNEALLKTLDINHQLLQGVASAMKSSFAVNAVVKYHTMMDEGKTEAALKELETKLKRSESGFLPIDLKNEFIPIKKDIAMVDSTTLKFIDEKILRHFGVPLPILTGDFTPQQMSAFYQKTLEGIVISYNQAFTKTLFTDREKGFNNKIQFFTDELQFQTVDQKLQMVTLLSNTGAIFENEKRVALGLMPMKELEGKRYMSLNWIDANKANEYQVGDTDE